MTVTVDKRASEWEGTQVVARKASSLVLGDQGGFLEEVLSRLELEGWTMAERRANQGVAYCRLRNVFTFHLQNSFLRLTRKIHTEGLNNLTKVRVKIWKGDCLRRGIVGERPEQKGRGQGKLTALRNWKQLREALKIKCMAGGVPGKARQSSRALEKRSHIFSVQTGTL